MHKPNAHHCGFPFRLKIRFPFPALAFPAQKQIFEKTKTQKNISKTKDFKLRMQISSSRPNLCSHTITEEGVSTSAMRHSFVPGAPSHTLSIPGKRTGVFLLGYQMMHPYFSTEQHKSYFRKAQGWQFFLQHAL